METNLMPKNAAKFYCQKCDFQCSKKSNYLKHLSTRKHTMETFGNDLMPKNAAKYFCDCGREYQTRAGLFKHKRKCNHKNKDVTDVTDEKVSHNPQNLDANLTPNSNDNSNGNSNDNLVNYLMKEHMK